MSDLTPEQLVQRVTLTKRGLCNLKLIDGKFHGLRIESGKTWYYAGVTPDTDDVQWDTRSGHEHLADALRVLGAVVPKVAAMDDYSGCWG